MYLYVPSEKDAYVPQAGLVPWPVEFILRHHAKHVYCSRALPPFEEVGKALYSWEQKVRWRFMFQQQRDEAANDISSPVHQRNRAVETA
jgi:hypothetical protein